MQVETLECVGLLTVSSCRGFGQNLETSVAETSRAVRRIRTELRKSGLSGGSEQNEERQGCPGNPDRIKNVRFVGGIRTELRTLGCPGNPDIIKNVRAVLRIRAG
jgi:hypothetical protein